MRVSQIASQPSQIGRPGETSLAAQSRSVSAVEFALLVLVLLVFTEGVLPRLVASEQSADGSPILRILWLPLYALIGLGLIWRARDIARTSLRLPFLMALLVLSALSFLWSIDPGLTQRRSLALLMTSAAGLYLGTRYNWQTLLRALGAAWLIIGLASFAAALLLPEFGRAQDIHDGAWKGFYFEKNQLGGHMALAALITAFLSLMDRKLRRFWLSAFVLSGLLVAASTSKTALLGMTLGLAVLITGALMKRGLRTAFAVAWASAVIAAVFGLTLWLAPDLIFDLLGREASLTGRTDIWAVLIGFIEQRPLLGYGYGAFWAEGSAAGDWVRETLQWQAPTAHNGWLEVALALGVTGLLLLVLDFLVTLIRAVLASFQTWAGLFALAF
ncbi:MAG: O-antigen ligase family protein, partial [Pseudomonadota bacterium]